MPRINLKQFSENTKHLDGRISTVFQRKLEMEVEQNYPTFEQSNERKRNDFIVRIQLDNVANFSKHESFK